MKNKRSSRKLKLSGRSGDNKEPGDFSVKFVVIPISIYSSYIPQSSTLFNNGILK